MRYSGNEYKTWNALARGMTSLKGHTLDIIAKTSTRNIDDFLLNLYYLNDINSALRKGRVDLNFSHLKNSNNDVYLYRGINICGAASWFNITIPKKANCTIQEIRKTFATELTKKINSTHGLEVIDTAPMSTSYSEDVAKIFSQDSTYSNNAIVMKIKAPGNRLKGIDMSLYSIHQDEEEILLPAGVKLKITKCEYDEKNNDAVVVYAEIINEWNDLNTNQK